MITSSLPVIIANDHGGFKLKVKIVQTLSTRYNFIDLGCYNDNNPVDYPDQANKLAKKMHKPLTSSYGILICGSGIGISIAANRYTHLRAALCHNIETARLSRQHNNANVLCLGGRILQQSIALKCVEIFLQTSFEGGRNQVRLDKLATR